MTAQEFEDALCCWLRSPTYNAQWSADELVRAIRRGDWQEFLDPAKRPEWLRALAECRT